MAIKKKSTKRIQAKSAKKKPAPKKVSKKTPAKSTKKKPAPKKVSKKTPAKSTKKKPAPKKVSKKTPAKSTKKKPAPKKVITNPLAKNTPTAPVAVTPVKNAADNSKNQPPVKAPVAGTPSDFEVSGNNPAALFKLKVYRGEGMVLLAMNWTNGKPPDNFVGFAIEYQEPGGNQFFAVTNRISFLKNDGSVDPNIKSSRLSPIQKFRWVHFPFHPELPGEFIYRVTPVFMDVNDVLSYGDNQLAAIQLASETYPGIMNVGFTRGFVASQAFVNHFGTNGGVGTIIPQSADNGLEFKPTDLKAAEALDWMGFEARRIILAALDAAINDESAQVRVLAYDFNVPEIVDRLVKLGSRVRVIIDDSAKKADANSPESKAAATLMASTGAANVQRQHMGDLQHNKTIAIKGDKVNLAIGGSTNMSWRGFFVQNNNAVLLYGPDAAQLFFDQFDNMWNNKNAPAGFGATPSANWNDLKLSGVTAKIAFSPHIASNAILKSIADDINGTTSSLFYSLAFLYQTPGNILNAIKNVTGNKDLFVYGISDRKVGGLDLQSPDGNPPSIFPAALLANAPEPFKQEATGGTGIRMHHKFVVIDFDKPTARVYTGSYNFSTAADTKNGENLLLIQDRKVAISYMIEAVTIFDHYEFRDVIAKSPINKIFLKVPPQTQAEKPWWDEDYTVPQKARDREIFS
jgi:phosphatidylserine/phosphatidylglycerophosphate/cardiolipin synthase-like enzyme